MMVLCDELVETQMKASSDATTRGKECQETRGEKPSSQLERATMELLSPDVGGAGGAISPYIERESS